MIDVQRYALLRKELLIENQKLIADRMKLNKRIREVRSELDALDRSLVYG